MFSSATRGRYVGFEKFLRKRVQGGMPHEDDGIFCRLVKKLPSFRILKVWKKQLTLQRRLSHALLGGASRWISQNHVSLLSMLALVWGKSVKRSLCCMCKRKIYLFHHHWGALCEKQNFSSEICSWLDVTSSWSIWNQLVKKWPRYTRKSQLAC